MSSGTYFGMEDFSKEELQYIQKNAKKTKRPLYRCENSLRVSKVGDVVDMYPMRSFTATKSGVNYIARTFDWDDEHDNTLYKTYGSTLYYDFRGITQDSEDFAGEDEVFVWGKFKVLDISEINLNKRVFKLVTIEQIDSKLKESLNESKDEFDSIVDNELKELNKWLDKYGCEVELVNDKEILDDIDWSSQYGEDAVGMFLRSIQDNASVFPIALNKKVIDNLCKDKYDLIRCIKTTLWHEAGHGIYDFLSDIYEMPDNEEDCVEEFARHKELSDLYDILKAYMSEY